MDHNRVSAYIEELYSDNNNVDKKEYIEKTLLDDFIPVVDQDVSRLLGLMLRIKGAKRVLEIGTSIGYSTVSMAKVLDCYGGTIDTIEYDEVVAKQALENFKRAGVNDTVNLLDGDAREILPKLKTDEYDVIFMDVEKSLYEPLLDDCIRVLKKGGVLMAEDTLFPVLNLQEKWKYLIPAIEEFNNALIKKDGIESTLLPIGDGVTIGVKL